MLHRAEVSMDAPSESSAQTASKPKRNNWKFYGLLGLIFIWYLFTIWYQATLATEDPRLRDFQTFSFRDTDASLTLEISYPKMVPVSPTSVAGQPITIWLLQSAATKPISATAPTSDSASYRISLQPLSDGLIFVNKDGTPIAPEFVATPAAERSTPWLAYVRRTPEEARYPMGLGIALRRVDANPASRSQFFAVYLDAQRVSTAQWRQFVAFLVSPTAPLIGLFITLAWKWYDNERKRQDEAQKASRFADINSLRPALERNDFRAVIPRLYEWQVRYADDSDATKLLAEVRRQLDSKPWQKTLLDEAVNSLAAGDYATALQTIELVLRLDSNNTLALQLKRVTRAAQQSADRDRSNELSNDHHCRSDSLTSLLQIYLAYPGRLDRIIGRLLAEVIPQDADRHLLEFRSAPYAYDLLNVRDLAAAIDRSTPQTLEAQAAKKQLRQTRQERWFRIIGTRGERVEQLRVAATWLQSAELSFNPFGPERAEDDPWLPDYAIDRLADDLSDFNSAWLSGPSGAGKTAAALLLAYDCFEPVYQPRIAETFPVYFAPTLAQGNTVDEKEWLRYLAEATSQALIRYLAIKPLHFLDLPISRQKTIARLLLTCCGTSKQLAITFNRTGLDRTEGNLVKTMAEWNLDIPAVNSIDQMGWIDLLKGALPAGFARSYLIIDFRAPATDVHVTSVCRPAMISLSELLKPYNIYLKVFAPPQPFEQPNSDTGSLKFLSLSWDDESLGLLLSQRLQQASRAGAAAGRDRLEDLCSMEARGNQIDRQLVEAAKTPRDVIHWGNRLFEIHNSSAADDPELSLADIERWQLEFKVRGH